MEIKYKIITVVMLFFVACFISPETRAITLFHADATDGGYIGDGRDDRFYSVSAVKGGYIARNNSLKITSDWWTILVSARDGVPLVPDKYELALSSIGVTHSFDYLTISTGSRACAYGDSLGRFVIHELEYDINGIVTKLAMDFEYTCYGIIDDHINGQIRLNSSLPEILNRPTAAAGRDQVVDEGWPVFLNGANSTPGASNITSYYWSQVSGPSIIINNQDSYAVNFIAPEVMPGGDTVVVELKVVDSGGGVDTDTIAIQVQDTMDPHSYLYLNKGDDYYPGNDEYYFPENYGLLKIINNTKVKFEGPITELFDFFPLAEGYYVDAEKPPYERKDKPRLDYLESCNGIRNIKPGRYLVHEIGYDASSNINKLAVDFIDHCLGDAYGAIRINSTIPLYRSKPYAVAGNDQTVFENSKVILNGDYSDSGSDIIMGNTDKIVSYEWTQVTGTTVTLIDADSAVAAFIAPSIASGEAVLTFELKVTDSEGLVDVDQVDVTVQSTDIIRSFVTIKDFSSKSYVFTDKTVNFEYKKRGSSGVAVQSVSASQWFSAALGTGVGSDFSPGVFSYMPDPPDAATYSPTAGVISLGVNAYGCNHSYGEIDVSDYTTEIIDSYETVATLALKFKHYCGEYALANDIKSSGKMIYKNVLEGEAPTANAGPDIIAYEGETINLDGTRSSDTDGSIINYNWRQLTGRVHDARYKDPFRVGEIPSIVLQPLPLGVDEEEAIFELTVYDDDGFHSSDVFTVKVLRLNSAPVANDDDVVVNKNELTKIHVKNNDTDADGVITKFIFGEEPKHGERLFTGYETIEYRPGLGFTGNDSFTYAVIDDFGAYSEFATVNITVESKQNADDGTSQDNSSGGGSSGGGSSGGLISIFELLLVFLVRLFRKRK